MDAGMMFGMEATGSLMDTRGQDLYFLGSLVKESFRRHDLDVSQEEVGEICSLLGDLNGVDVAEIFSPLRFSKECGRFGLQPGLAADLLTNKPYGTPWDLSMQADRKKLFGILEAEDPELLVGSPPCTVFSRLRELSDHKRDPAVVEAEREEGCLHLNTSVLADASQ